MLFSQKLGTYLEMMQIAMSSGFAFRQLADLEGKNLDYLSACAKD